MTLVKSTFLSAAAALSFAVTGTMVPMPAQAAATASEAVAAVGSQQAVTAVVTRFVDAWNAHDGNALGQVFTEDGDFVGISGIPWHGPAEIARVHSEQFAGRYDKSAFAVDGTPGIAFIKPDVALVHWRWTISGVRDANGAPVAPYRGIFTWVVINRGGLWQVRAAQNNVSK